MLRKILFIAIVVSTATLSANNPLLFTPEKGFEKRIVNYIHDLHVVNTHEHTLLPDSLTKWSSLDFMLLFSSYAYDDMISAGLDKDTYFSLLNDSVSVAKKWSIVEPFWNKAKNTAYCRNSLLIAKELYGVNELNAQTVEIVSKKIKNAYKNPNWLYELADKAKIDFWITDGYWIQGGGPRELKGERFRFVSRFEDYITIWSKNSIAHLSTKCKTDITTLSGLEEEMVKAFDSAQKKGIVGVKTGIAYSRIIYFEDVKREIAEKIFDEMMKQGYSNNTKLLQDYMMHYLIKLAEKNGLPMIFHTGLHAGNGNEILNSKPTHLVNLLKLYPKVNFVFYHGSFPYGGELMTIVKNFPNAWLDMSWLYLISPTYAKDYLHQWLETIPASKIMAFGGDGRNIEATYGHLIMAKQVVSQVLIEKVQSGYFSEQEAKEIAKTIFYDSAVNFYKLK